jgi:hypothetical protein
MDSQVFYKLDLPTVTIFRRIRILLQAYLQEHSHDCELVSVSYVHILGKYCQNSLSVSLILVRFVCPCTMLPIRLSLSYSP